MLFTSYEFLIVFLPIVLIVNFVVRNRLQLRNCLIALASFSFYVSWDWRFLGLLIGSIAVNYLLGVVLQRAVAAGERQRANAIATFGVVLNLLVLGLFKYLAFVIENINGLTGAGMTVARWVLPLGISFFTFEQIGFLVDLRRGAVYRLDPLRFTVFISFFPRLVAGPILRYGEIVPQLERPEPGPYANQLALGLSIFAIGLAKKAFLADGIAPYVGGPFDAAASGGAVDLLAAWGGALAYTCQLYFDFSGYSDMAIGAARCFGLRFPENFDSPYKSASIVEFWRRWHMTLSRFLRDYVYISLGGNRRGPVRRYVNLFLTMAIGGFWHGANWTFLVWGGLHGCYLVLNHAWTTLAGLPGRRRPSLPGQLAGTALTFLAVVVAWVFFRAPTLGGALAMLRAMAGENGAELPGAVIWRVGRFIPGWLDVRTGGGSGAVFAGTWMWVGGLLALAFFAPNRQAIVGRVGAALALPGAWRTPAWAAAVGLAAFLGFLSVNRAGAFLYWQF